MKKINTLILLAILLLISACGNKLAFKPQEALTNGSLVYIYVPVRVSSDDGSTASDYMIRINNKLYKRRIEQGEYISLELKSNQTKISVTKREIEEKVLDLNLQASKIYYLKITDDMSDGGFMFEVMDAKKGLKEISKTGLAGTNEESSQNVITEFFKPEEKKSSEIKETKTTQKTSIAPPPPSTKQNISKTDEIMKAYGLKEKGVITDKEFNALKTDILNK